MCRTFVVRCPFCKKGTAKLLFSKKGDTAAIKCDNCGTKPMPISLCELTERFPEAREIRN